MKQFYFFVFVVLPFWGNAQFSQLGDDIIGETSQSLFGFATSLNENGSRIAVGALRNLNDNGRNAGHARVYEFVGNNWVQLGGDIDGENEDDRFGYDVSLSSDGSRVAVGSHMNDTGGRNAGHTRIFQFTGGDWVQLGSTIIGEGIDDMSGFTVSLSGNGNRVAIGARANRTNDSGIRLGHTRIFEFNGTDWQQLGSDIDGEAVNDNFGYDVSLNESGSMVAIGGRSNDGTAQDAGHVRVFSFEGNNWVQVGQDIDGEAERDEFGYTVSLNDVGDRVAIGALLNDGNGLDSGHVRVFQLIANSWVQIGRDLDGENPGDRYGEAISLSGDGNTLAIGARSHANESLTGVGHVQMFRLESGNWTQFGEDLNGELQGDQFGTSVTLNSDGSILGVGNVGSINNANFLGLTRVFDLTGNNTDPDAFTTTWKTDNPGTSSFNQIAIPTFPSETYNYTIDWGDGTSDSGVAGDITHTYTTPGTYTISISGVFPRIFFNNAGDRQKLLSVEQWGNIAWNSMQRAFLGCSNLDVLALDTPNLDSVSDLSQMFVGCARLEGNASFGNWDVSAVNNMLSVFGSVPLFNQDIGSWDVGSVTNMSNMFNKTSSFNQDLSSWDVSNVVSMAGMFVEASSFNQDIGNWDVGKVRSMSAMFGKASVFNQDIGSWNVSEVVNMQSMFYQAIAFDQDISNWDVSRVTNMGSMFSEAVAFNQDIGGWEVSAAVNMNFMFADATQFDQDLGGWNVAAVTLMANMFNNVTLSTVNYDRLLQGWGTQSLQPNVSFSGGNSQFCLGEEARQSIIDTFGWTITDGGKAEDCTTELPFVTTWKTDNPGSANNNTPNTQITIPTFPGGTYNYTVDWGDGTSNTGVVGNITHDYAIAGTYAVTISGIFPRIYFNAGIDRQKIIAVNQWGTNAWTSMENAFFGCFNLDVTAMDIPDLSNVSTTGRMFSGCEDLVGNTSFADWDVSSITDMNNMLGATVLFNQDISSWDVSNVTNMRALFSSARVFDQDISSWNVSNVTNMSNMFGSAFAFNQDIGNWDVGNVTVMNSMFSQASVFDQDIGAWDVSAVTNMSSMFSRASAFNQDISGWNVAAVTNMGGMFFEATSFDQSIGVWNISSATNMTNMFKGATSFNQDIGNWNIRRVSNLSGMFQEALAFDQDLGDWNISSATNMTNMFEGAGLSLENYDTTLIGWNTLVLGEPRIPENIVFSGGSSQYCDAETARQNLIDTFGWTITDGGLNCPARPFITTWKTDNPGISNANQITIPVDLFSTYAYVVDWGDGTSPTSETGEATHTYATVGTYTVSITGNFPRLRFGNQGDKEKLLTVEQWGDIEWQSMQGAFHGCSNLDIVAIDIPNLENSISMQSMFNGCSSLVGNNTFNDWDISNVISLESMFSQCPLFNQDIGEWNTSSVIRMKSMFFKAGNFNQNIGNWDTSSVIDMSAMFVEVVDFNQDIGNWDTSSVTTMANMFSGARTFNQDIGGWDTSKVTSMNNMFLDAVSFNQDIGLWDVSAVTGMRNMFRNAREFNHDISGWNVSSVAVMSSMFRGAFNFDQNIDIWITSSVTAMDAMFQGATRFNQDIGSWNTSQVTNMRAMFLSASAFEQNIGGWDISSLTNAADMFQNITLSTENYDALLNGWSTLGPDETAIPSNIIFDAGNSEYCLGNEGRQALLDLGWQIDDGDLNCPQMPFVTLWKTDNPGTSGTDQITIPVFADSSYNYTVNWGDGTSDTGVTGAITHTYAVSGTYTVSISGVFPRIYFNNGGDRQKLLSVQQWGGIIWTSFANAFHGCSNLDVVATDVPDLSGVTDFSSIFEGCTALVGTSSFGLWDTSTITLMRNAFFGAGQFNQDIGSWNVSLVTNMGAMFSGCSSFNQNIGAWNVANVSSMSAMFRGATIFNQNIGGWNVGNVRIMASMFEDAFAFDQDISSWNVSLVRQVARMFRNARTFNQNIGIWNINGIQTTVSMFEGATIFNQDISGWDLSSCTLMTAMFKNATAFDQPIGSWDVSAVTDMFELFRGAAAFNGDIANWNTALVTNMASLFRDAISFNQNINTWNVGNVTTMADMCFGATRFNQNVESWNVGLVSNMNRLFLGTTLSLEHYDAILQGWGNLPVLQPNVTFNAGESNVFCFGEEARQTIIDTYGWTIIDGGRECPQTPFVTVWKTDNPGTSASNQITIPTFSGINYNYTVDWGDGSLDTGVTGTITHTYSTPGTYTVSISGDFPRIYFNGGGDAQKILDVIQWGGIVWRSMEAAFYGCVNLEVSADDAPDLSLVSSLARMFLDCRSLVGTAVFNTWNVSTVTDISRMFEGCTWFNQNIGSWNVGNVTRMDSVFNGAVRFNQNIGSWNVERVTTMASMFFGCTAFNQNLGSWNVGLVTNMSAMFSGCSSFNGNISSWNVGSVTNMDQMFFGCSAFNQNIGGWNVANVTTMASMFSGALVFNQNIGSWNVGRVTDMGNMFFGCRVFDQDLDSWNVGSVQNMSGMFADCISFNGNIGNWDVTSVTNMNRMFSGCIAFSQNLGSWNIANVRDIDEMFNGVRLSLFHYDRLLLGWSTLSLQPNLRFNGGSSTFFRSSLARETLVNTFGWTISDGGANTGFITTWKTDNPGTSASNRITIPIPENTALTFNYNVDWGDGTVNIGLSDSFTHTYAVPGVYTVSITGNFPTISFVGRGDAQKLIAIEQWGEIEWRAFTDSFRGCSNLDVIATDVPNLNAVESLRGMFFGCTSLVGNAGFNDWNTSTITDMSVMFQNAILFNQPIGNWDVGNVINMNSLFSEATAFDQPIGSWNVGNVQIMSNMFRNTSFNQDISNWNVGRVVQMNSMFQNNPEFNQPIGIWDVSSVVLMNSMFATTSFNRDISGWNVGQVNSMAGMFLRCPFNHDIGNWDVSRVTDMGGMFREATFFNQDIGSWDVSSVTNMRIMFEDAIRFDQDLGNWNVGQVSQIDNMFRGIALSTANYDALLIGWSNLQLQPNLSFDGGNSQFFLGAFARQRIIETYGWSIVDGGGNGLENAFVTTWRTTHPGTSQDNQITIPTFPGIDYNYTVDWGDGTMDTGVTGDITHTYASPGLYRVSILGEFPRIYFNNSGDKLKLLNLPQWGNIQWTSMERAFYGCSNFNVTASDTPNLSQVTSMRRMFQDCSSLSAGASFNRWDVSHVTDMRFLFNNASFFDISISNWNVGNVRNMSGMFRNATLFNQDIGGWDVSSVRNMSGMFRRASNFNQNIGNWDVGSVRNMPRMFDRAEAFDQNIGNWDVSRVVDMGYMFNRASAFDQDIGSWDIGQVVAMDEMFANVRLSTDNYDALLIGWSSLPSVQNNVTFDGGRSRFCISEGNRQALIENFGWTITDRGVSNTCAPQATVLIATLVMPSIEIYPNPTASRITVNTLDVKEGITGFEVLDASGRMVIKKKAPKSSPKYELRVEELPDGIYFLNIMGQGRIVAQKRFMVSH